jgi:hypothetical protein
MKMYEYEGAVYCKECVGYGLLRGILDNPELVKEVGASRSQTCFECGEAYP